MFWPLVPKLVRHAGALPVGYGLITCTVNATLTLVPSLVASSIRADPSYRSALVLLALFGGSSVLGIIACH